MAAIFSAPGNSDGRTGNRNGPQSDFIPGENSLRLLNAILHRAINLACDDANLTPGSLIGI